MPEIMPAWPTAAGSHTPAAEPSPETSVLGLIPCYNVGAACVPVVEGARARLGSVVAVDDGSTDGTSAHLAATGVPVLTHAANRGKGAALLTGFRWALYRGFEKVLTLDGDGQHDPADIPRLLDAAAGADLVIGVREVSRKTAPLRSWVGNALSGRAFAWLSQTGIRDCQSGYRVYGARFLSRVLPRLTPGRYETEMELLLYAARNGFRLAAEPVRTIYSDESRRLSHFEPCADTLRVVGSMARGFGGYGLSREP
ncbi:MAG: glycosyltransferase family 2 protein [Thermodesulfobacteriota bacterium]